MTVAKSRQLLVGALILSSAATVATYDTYDNGFWDAKGLLTIKDYGELEAMRTQPSDVHVHDVNEFTDERGWSESGVVPTTAWLGWNIYQPARYIIIDFTDSNGHQDAENGINAAAGGTTFAGGDGFTSSGTFTVTDGSSLFPDGHHDSVETLTTDVACEFRSSERKINDISTQTMIATTLTVTDASGATVVSFADCEGATAELQPGTYSYAYEVTVSGALALNASITTETAFTIASYQPLLVWGEDAPASLAGHTVNLSNSEEMALGASTYEYIENPSYHKNPKAQDAKHTYALFIPCVTFGALDFVLLR
jgi:hypothetical protein